MDRVRALLGVTSDVQAVRLALRRLMREADSYDTPEVARAQLAADIAAVQAIRAGRKPKDSTQAAA